MNFGDFPPYLILGVFDEVVVQWLTSSTPEPEGVWASLQKYELFYLVKYRDNPLSNRVPRT
jgi:hypothetical protein